MQGYFRDPEGTAKALEGDWLLTGDIGSLDSESYLKISGRRKEMIKIFGESVSALGVEAVITSLPGVSETAVIGVPHPVSGEAICVFVVRAPGTAVDEEAIRLHCAKTLGKSRVPWQVRFIRELPRTASGKVRKNLLVVD
jgi:acyl-CoA synthetase (AMP-forming)/AMP-acid ligase II